MSLAAESPVHSSSSSDDFASFLDAELELASSDTSPDEDHENDEEDEDFEEHRAKRQRVEDAEVTNGLSASMVLETAQESIGSSSKKSTYEDMCPPHPGFIKGMCMRCGQIEDDESGVAFGYIHKDLRLGSKEINRLQGADLKNLLQSKKLILILDLDHTLLNSTRLADMSPQEEYVKHEAESMRANPERSIFQLFGTHLLTKLRPFVRTFLQEASKMFEMYVYTMGERPYALEIAKILDPNRSYFDTRVISQADSTKRHLKGLDVVLGDRKSVV